MRNFVGDIRVQEWVEGTQSDPVLFSSALRRPEELNWDVDGSLGWYCYEYRSGVVRGVLVYQR